LPWSLLLASDQGADVLTKALPIVKHKQVIQLPKMSSILNRQSCFASLSSLSNLQIVFMRQARYSTTRMHRDDDFEILEIDANSHLDRITSALSLAISTCFHSSSGKSFRRGTLAPVTIPGTLATVHSLPRWPHEPLPVVRVAADAARGLLHATKPAISSAAVASPARASNPAKNGPTRNSTRTSMSLPNSSSLPPHRTFRLCPHCKSLRRVHPQSCHRNARLRDR